MQNKLWKDRSSDIIRGYEKFLKTKSDIDKLSLNEWKYVTKKFWHVTAYNRYDYIL